MLLNIVFLYGKLDVEVFILHSHALTLLLLVVVPPGGQHPCGLGTGQEVTEHGERGIVAVNAVVVTAMDVVILAAEAESVDQQLVSVRLARGKGGEVVFEVGVRKWQRLSRAIVAVAITGPCCRRWSWTCRLVLWPMSRLTFCKANHV